MAEAKKTTRKKPVEVDVVEETAVVEKTIVAPAGHIEERLSVLFRRRGYDITVGALANSFQWLMANDYEVEPGTSLGDNFAQAVAKAAGRDDFEKLYDEHLAPELWNDFVRAVER